MIADATLLQMKYARIISLLAKKANIDEEKANDIFLRRNCITDEERFSFF